MAQRSPYNDRYKTEQKGKTRKSAAGAKPRREAGASGSAAPAKKETPKKRSLWGRGPAAPPVPVVTSPELKKLRRIWWVLWVASLLIAVAILFLQQGAKADPSLNRFVPFLWGLWTASLGGAFYLEFSPIRKARAAAIEAEKSKSKKKSKKGDAE